MPENSSCSSAGSCTKSSCEGCPSHNGGPQSFLVEQNKFSNIKHVIGVVSGKGGIKGPADDLVARRHETHRTFSLGYINTYTDHKRPPIKDICSW